MEDGCETSLSLDLSLSTNLQRRALKPPPPAPPLQQEPSLTLSLSEEICAKETRLSSSHSTVSSFSTSNIKKETMVDVAAGEETEVQRGTSFRASDEEEEATARKKLRLTKDQSALLEDRFKEHTTLSPKQKQALSKQLNLRPRQIEVWFQNRRARTKLKQTEVDCDFLRRCCETLTEENRRLHKELQEMKALNFTAVPRPPPFFVQLPATTLTFCSSCERIAGAGRGKASNMTDDAVHPDGGMPKQHFFNPFAHSAACQL